MNPRAIKVEAFDDYSLVVNFVGGETRKFNVTRLLDYPVYTALKEISFFKKAIVKDGIVVWDLSIDLDPDLLYLESMPVETQVSR